MGPAMINASLCHPVSPSLCSRLGNQRCAHFGGRGASVANAGALRASPSLRRSGQSGMESLPLGDWEGTPATGPPSCPARHRRAAWRPLRRDGLAFAGSGAVLQGAPAFPVGPGPGGVLGSPSAPLILGAGFGHAQDGGQGRGTRVSFAQGLHRLPCGAVTFLPSRRCPVAERPSATSWERPLPSIQASLELPALSPQCKCLGGHNRGPRWAA